MRYPLLCSMASSLVLLSACDDQSIQSNCSYYVQQDLDNSQYDDAIELLSSATCQNSYPENEYLVDLSTAYLGKSGYSLPTILSAAIDDTNSNSDSFSTFVAEISSLQNNNSLYSLQKSDDSLNEYLGQTCVSITDSTSSETGICLMQGIIDLTKTALAIDYLSGNAEEWVSTNDTSIMELSTCALQYAIDYDSDPTITLPYSCDIDVEVNSSESVTFSNETISKSYQHLKAINTNTMNTDYYLQSTSLGSLVFTYDYCETDFTPCTDITEASCYACPSQDAEDLPINDFVLDSLNSGLSNIESLLSDTLNSNNDSEIQESIDEFILDISPDGCDTKSEECFNIDDVVDYLNNN